MMNIRKKISQAALALAFAGLSSAAWAIPALQLDILGGTYDTTTETTIAGSNVFSLYALGDTTKVNTTTKYYLSIALLNGTLQTGNLGTFKVNGSTVDVVSDMVFGNPPFESMQDHDAGDLGSHGIFPTWFTELEFFFDQGSEIDAYNAEDDVAVGNGAKMYAEKFDFDLTGLQIGTTLHFDLYSSVFKELTDRECTGTGQSRVCNTVVVGVDVDADEFAPFSHDAQGTRTPPTVPLPAAAPLLLSGLGVLGFATRRRKIKAEAA